VKTLIVSASGAVLGAFVLSSVSFESATSVLCAAGFLAIAFSDYSRRVCPITIESATVVRRSECFGLAA
jgi:hypothetical protein